MRKFRSEYMHNIRLKIIYNQLKVIFQIQIILLRRSQIFYKSIAVTGHILS